jgi:hypothetical protein
VARIRQLKPEFWTDDKVAGLSRDARLLFLGLWTEADDDGRLVDSTKLLAGSLFPFDDDVTPKRLGTWLEEIISQGLVRRYTRGAASYLYIVNFKRHQKIAHPRRSSLPPPDDDPRDAGGTREDRQQPASDPPATRARDLGIKGSRGQGVEGVGVPDEDRSSSSNTGVGDDPAEEEDHSQSWNSLLVARLVARRRHDKRDEPIPEGYRRDSWLKTTAEDVQAKHSPEILDHLAAGHPIEAVVDLLEPPEQAPAAPASPYPAYVPPADPGSEPADAGNGLAMVRSALGGGA